MTRAHAWLLTCACAAILFLSFPTSAWRLVFASATLAEVSTKPKLTQSCRKLRRPRSANAKARSSSWMRKADALRALVNPKAAFAEAAMPGSTMKPFTALAALRAGLIDQDSRTVCPGRFTGLNFSLPCVHADHLPPFTPSQAIAYSCNYYFATLGQRLGRDKLIETLRPFGFGQLTGLSEDAAGTLRPCETGNSARIQSPSRIGAKRLRCARSYWRKRPHSGNADSVTGRLHSFSERRASASTSLRNDR